MRLEGGCYCKALRFEAEGEPMMQAMCHCRECQYIAGGGPNFFIAMPADGFRYTKGEPGRFARSDLARPVTREFCQTCGTHVVTRPVSGPMVIVKVGALDDTGQFAGPQFALFTVDRPPYHQTPEGIPAFERFPPR